MLHRPCFLPADTKEAINARRGQIGRGSYLGRIMFDILHHYQLPPVLQPPPGVISLPRRCAAKRNEFFMSPTLHLRPTPPLNLPSPAQGAAAGGNTKKKKKKGELIDVPCHRKQNGKYNLAFSLCADNGANTRAQTNSRACYPSGAPGYDVEHRSGRGERSAEAGN